MRVAPFYSLYLGLAVEDVWHNNTSCEIGDSIILDERWPGRDGRKQCPYCQLLNTPFSKTSAVTDRSIVQ
jgi:hypothetical protein